MTRLKPTLGVILSTLVGFLAGLILPLSENLSLMLLLSGICLVVFTVLLLSVARNSPRDSEKNVPKKGRSIKSWSNSYWRI